MKNIVVIYHGDCPDGFGGAWAAWKKFGAKARYILGLHHAPPAKIKNSEVYFVDFVYPVEAMKRFVKDNRRVVVIDHHISAKPVLKLVKEKLYSMTNSGAVLACKYFHRGQKVPRLLLHLDDMDRWQFKMPHTRELMTYLSLVGYDFKTWNKLVTDVENQKQRRAIVNLGGWLVKYEDKQIKRVINNAQLVKLAGHKTWAVNSPIWESEIGSALVKKLPPLGIVWRKKGNGRITVSLRSNGQVDVAKLAAKFGGGGHKRAAGFVVNPGNKLPWKEIKK